MYEHEEVEESEGKELAKQLGAIFQKTSAKEASGVEDLFVNIVKKFLNPDSTEGSPSSKGETKEDKKKIRLEKGQSGPEKKKGCC